MRASLSRSGQLRTHSPAQSGRRAPWRKLYGRRWRAARLAYLQRNPLCVMCSTAGRVEPATVVDHVRPHRGDVSLFWDQCNWQGLCTTHHDRDKQRSESVDARVAGIKACDVDGYTEGGSW